jgi:two-component sensor histidine kinase
LVSEKLAEINGSLSILRGQTIGSKFSPIGTESNKFALIETSRSSVLSAFIRLLVFLFLLSAPPLFGQGKGWIRFSSNSGLNSEEVYAVFEDPKGYLWVSTEMGTLRYTGLGFEKVPGFPPNSDIIYAYAQTPDGKLWLYNSAGQLGFYWEDQFHPVSHNEILSRKTIGSNKPAYRMTASSNGEFIFLQFRSGVWTYDTKKGELKETNHTNWDTSQVVIKENQAFLLPAISFWKKSWTGAEPKKLHWKWASNAPAYPQEIEFHRAIGLRHEDKWIFGLNRELFVVNDSGRVLKKRKFSQMMIQLKKLKDGSVWASFYNKGIYRINSELDTLEHFLYGNSVSDIALSRNGNLCISTLESGLFVDKSPGIICHNNIPPPISLLSVVDNKLIAGGNDRQLHVFSTKEKKSVSLPFRFRYLLTDIFKFENGTYGLGGSAIGYRLGPDFEWKTHFIVKPELNLSATVDFERADSGQILCTQRRGLGLLDGDTIKAVIHVKGQAREVVYFHKKAFLGTDFGILEFNVSHSKLTLIKTWFPGWSIRKLKMAHGRLWASVKEKGLFVLDDKPKWTKIKGLDHWPYIFDFLFPSDSSLILATSRGTVKTRFYPSKGIVTRSQTIDDVPSTALAIWNDTLWIASRQGLFSLAYPEWPAPEPILQLARLSADGKPWNFNESSVFPAGQKDLRFEFHLLHDPGKEMKMHYALSGKRTRAGWANDQQVYLPDLPAGSYILTIQAREALGIPGGKTWNFAFSIQPAWWEVRWVQVVAGLVFFLLLAWLVKKLIFYYRNRDAEASRLQQLLLSYRVTALQNQMNPHFISNSLSAIQNLILGKEHEKANLYLTKFSRMLRRVLHASDTQWSSLEEELAVIRINVELEQLRFARKFDFQIDFPDHINPKNIILPTLITQPLVENAIWHGLLPMDQSRFPKLSIHLRDMGNLFELEIEDNGVGRSQNSKTWEGRTSKGQQLVFERLNSLNIWLKEDRFQLQFVDLKDPEGKPCGTRAIISFPKNLHEKIDQGLFA